jgi:hypothetical protein
LREHLDFFWNYKRYNNLRNYHKEINHNICGDWAIGFIQENEDPSQPSDLEKTS